MTSNFVIAFFLGSVKIICMVNITKIAEKEEIEIGNETGSQRKIKKNLLAGAGLSVSGETNAGNKDKDLKAMFIAGVHFGYSRSTRHPKMDPYIFGVRNNVEIFDLEKTKALLEKAENFLKELAAAGKKIMIVATKPAIRQMVEGAVKESGLPYVCERWLGGTLTNFKVIRSRIDYFVSMRQKKESGELNKYTKKEISMINKELLRMERFFKGLEPLTSLPSALLIIDPGEEKTAVNEALALSIPIIAVLNSDCNPTGIAYPIPANDASISSVRYLLDSLLKSYQKGRLLVNNDDKPRTN